MMANIDWSRLFLATTGRISRTEFWVGAVFIILVGLVAVAVIGGAFGDTALSEEVVFVAEVILGYGAYCVMAKRFHDRGRPSAFALLAVAIPLVTSLLTLFGVTQTGGVANLFGQVLNYVNLADGIWIVVDLGVLRGVAGSNAYGPDPTAAASRP